MGWIMTRAVDGVAVVIGHLPAVLRPGKLGKLRVPAIERKPNVIRVNQSHHVTTRWENWATSAAIRSRSPIPRGWPSQWDDTARNSQNIQFRRGAVSSMSAGRRGPAGAGR